MNILVGGIIREQFSEPKMAKLFRWVESILIERERVAIVCSAPGCEVRSPYSGPKAALKWEGKEWFCEEHRPPKPEYPDGPYRDWYIFFAYLFGYSSKELREALGISQQRILAIYSHKRRTYRLYFKAPDGEQLRAQMLNGAKEFASEFQLFFVIDERALVGLKELA